MYIYIYFHIYISNQKTCARCIFVSSSFSKGTKNGLNGWSPAIWRLLPGDASGSGGVEQPPETKDPLDVLEVGKMGSALLSLVARQKESYAKIESGSRDVAQRTKKPMSVLPVVCWMAPWIISSQQAAPGGSMKSWPTPGMASALRCLLSRLGDVPTTGRRLLRPNFVELLWALKAEMA